MQDAICDAGDLLKEAKPINPKHLALFMVACFEPDGLPATPPHYVTAASEEEALAIWKAAFKDEFGRRKPRAERVPDRGGKARVCMGDAVSARREYGFRGYRWETA